MLIAMNAKTATTRYNSSTVHIKEQRMVSINPPGRLAGRFFKSLAVARGDMTFAASYAAGQRWTHSSEIAAICKASVAAMDSASQSAALQPVITDLAPMVAKLSIMGRLTGFRRVPSRTQCVTSAPGATAFWSGGVGGPAALSRLAFVSAQLDPQRVVAMSVITKELAQSSDPNAETTISTDQARAIAERIDSSFLDPENKGSPEILPRSVTYDSQKFVSSGSAVANTDADLLKLVTALSDGGSDLQSAAWCLNPVTATYLGTLRGSGGGLCYPNIGARGGTLLGLPALTSASVARTGSPAGTFIALVDPTRVWTVDEGIEFAVSATANLEMVDNPTNSSSVPTATNTVSLFQTESLSIKSVSFVNWKPVTNASAAAVLTNVTF